MGIAVAPDSGGNLEQALQGSRALFGTPFLIGTQCGIDEDHGKDKNGIGYLTHNDRYHTSDYQEVNQWTHKLVQDNFEERGTFLLW